MCLIKTQKKNFLLQRSLNNNNNNKLNSLDLTRYSIPLLSYEKIFILNINDNVTSLSKECSILYCKYYYFVKINKRKLYLSRQKYFILEISQSQKLI